MLKTFGKKEYDEHLKETCELNNVVGNMPMRDLVLKIMGVGSTWKDLTDISVTLMQGCYGNSAYRTWNSVILDILWNLEKDGLIETPNTPKDLRKVKRGKEGNVWKIKS